VTTSIIKWQHLLSSDNIYYQVITSIIKWQHLLSSDNIYYQVTTSIIKWQHLLSSDKHHMKNYATVLFIWNCFLWTIYSGIRHLSFPTSCDIRHKFMVPRFLLTKIKPKYSDILYNPTHFPWPLVCWIRQGKLNW
jgi:hypothetical protein